VTGEHAPAEFTLSGYASLVSAFKEMGYAFCAFSGARREKAHLVMRHDVDFCPKRALRIAQVEKELGISATYFFLVSTEFYNIYSSETARCLREIKNMGHHIGLHFDAATYDLSKIDEAAEAECQSLAGVVGDIEIVSFHRPIVSLQGASTNIAGRPHTYQPRYFHEIEYCSDSGGEWSFGYPLERQAIRDRKALQLVTHPIWWAEDDVASPIDRMTKFLAERTQVLRSELQRNLKKGHFVDNWIDKLV